MSVPQWRSEFILERLLKIGGFDGITTPKSRMDIYRAEILRRSVADQPVSSRKRMTYRQLFKYVYEVDL